MFLCQKHMMSILFYLSQQELYNIHGPVWVSYIKLSRLSQAMVLCVTYPSGAEIDVSFRRVLVSSSCMTVHLVAINIFLLETAIGLLTLVVMLVPFPVSLARLTLPSGIVYKGIERYRSGWTSQQDPPFGTNMWSELMACLPQCSTYPLLLNEKIYDVKSLSIDAMSKRNK